MLTAKAPPQSDRAGEAAAHVQSFGLKAVAVVLVRLTNSPVTRIVSRRAAGRSGDPLTSCDQGSYRAMNDYNFLKDLLDTYQSSPAWVQAVWVIAPPLIFFGFLWCLAALVLRYRHLKRTGVVPPLDAGRHVLLQETESPEFLNVDREHLEFTKRR